jgi:hypothetical protein
MQAKRRPVTIADETIAGCDERLDISFTLAVAGA